VSRYFRTLAVMGAIGLGLAACGSPPPEEPDQQNDTGSAKPGAADFKACMVSDEGGFDDKSFNQTSYKGLQDAVSELGITEVKIESQSPNDYPTNVNSMVREGCDIIVTVGFALADVTYETAKANPDIDFAIVDAAYDPSTNPPLDNLKSLLFNTAQSSFLAGYLAAGVSKSGKVGTFGGRPFPTVTIFMDGFWEGVQYYNDQKGTDVQVLGWNEENQKGSFTGDFESGTKAQNTANNLINSGADVIFPVAGPAGLGGLQAAKASGGKATAIWVDTDGCVSAAEYCSILQTSVYKAMDLAVRDAIVDSFNDEFDNTPYVGTLENKGTGLSPFHEFDDDVPAELKAELEQIEEAIINGEITIKSDAQPKP